MRPITATDLTEKTETSAAPKIRPVLKKKKDSLSSIRLRSFQALRVMENSQQLFFFCRCFSFGAFFFWSSDVVRNFLRWKKERKKKKKKKEKGYILVSCQDPRLLTHLAPNKHIYPRYWFFGAYQIPEATQGLFRKN